MQTILRRKIIFCLSISKNKYTFLFILIFFIPFMNGGHHPLDWSLFSRYLYQFICAYLYVIHEEINTNIWGIAATWVENFLRLTLKLNWLPLRCNITNISNIYLNPITGQITWYHVSALCVPKLINGTFPFKFFFTEKSETILIKLIETLVWSPIEYNGNSRTFINDKRDKNVRRKRNQHQEFHYHIFQRQNRSHQDRRLAAIFGRAVKKQL